MEGYTQTEYFKFTEEDDEEDEEEDWNKKKVKYTLLKEEDFDED